MWYEVFNVAINNGIWAVLFVALLVYQIKDSKIRESKYQKTICELNASLTVVNKVDKKVIEIGNEVDSIAVNVVSINKKINQVSSDVNAMNRDTLRLQNRLKKQTMNKEQEG